jgi:hypothetical protein
MKMIPAGVSKKTGKAYRAFEVCEKPACKAIKEQSRYNVPPSTQNAPQSNFNPIQNDLQIKIDELNQTIAKMRTAFMGMDERIKSLETFALGANKPAFDLHGSSHTDIPVIQATDGDKINIEFPEGFLK